MGKTILITGATSGIGYEVAKKLVLENNQVIFTARNADKAEKVKNEWISMNPNARVDFVICDFASLQSVKNMAERFKQENDTLDILINNAGVWEMERKESTDGIEMNFAVNHLAPFLLTNLLIPTLKKSNAARIINTSSMAHRRNILHLDDLEYKNQPYDGIATYSQSKLCNILFTLELSQILADSQVTANTVHPGYVKTELFNNMGNRDWGNVPPATDGARSTLYAALSDEMEGVSGQFIYHENFETPTPMAQDTTLAHQVWNASMKYVEKFLTH